MGNTEKIMDFLLREGSMHNVNQLARSLKISVGSAHAIIKGLEKRNVVQVQELGNARYYSLNFKNVETLKLCELLLLQQRRFLLEKNSTVRVYSSDLEKNQALAVVLFGSIITHPREANDVDVLFIIKRKKEVSLITAFCLGISQLRTKHVSPLILQERDFVINLHKKNKVVEDIVKKGVVLKGEDIFVRGIANAYKK